jgi:hypothetical protein
MTVSRRELMTYGAASAFTALAAGNSASAATQDTGSSPNPTSVPLQLPSDRVPQSGDGGPDHFDMRNGLQPRRLTLAMWDQAYVMRHVPGGSFADFPRVLDETVERGYNTVRIDPMPQFINLRDPDRVLEFGDPHQPYMPWGWNTAVKGPVGRWIIEFMEELHKRPSLNYTLSAWWFMGAPPPAPDFPPPLRRPKDMAEGAEMWAVQLRDWKQRFGFDHLVYVDIANEVPYFFPDVEERLKKATGKGWGDAPTLTPAQTAFMAEEINKPLGMLRREFPELRFTISIHGDLRWFDIPVELDCLDVHFYADVDPRWSERTRFPDFTADGLFVNNRWFAEFSERCTKTAAAMAPMLRARQRFKMGEFAGWARRRGAALTTSEGWSSWYYIDDPALDWGWLLDWSKWTVDDAIDYKFWGWTPHNYAQPQFANWKDVKWHRTMSERFLRS